MISTPNLEEAKNGATNIRAIFVKRLQKTPKKQKKQPPEIAKNTSPPKTSPKNSPN
jgi:hypothetical protein